MTLYDLTRVLLRRWYVMVIVLGLTAGLGWLFLRDGGLYVTRTLVTFEAPDAGPWEEGGSADRGVIMFASAVAAEVNGGAEPVTYSQADAPFYGAGIRQGLRVALPDTGGQWEVVYNKAAITVDVVSPDRGWVEEQQTGAIRSVLAAADDRQTGMSAENRIAVAVEPLSETIEHVTPSRSGMALAAAALGAVGLLVGGWFASTADRLARESRERSGGIRGMCRWVGGSGIS